MTKSIRGRRPTMRDVAEEAGVGIKTVSRVVNRESGVGADTAARVSAAIAKLGFRRDDVARSLRPGQRSKLIGLIIADLRNPFYSAVASAIERVARDREHNLIVANTDEDPEREREAAESLITRRVDGLIIVPAGEDHSWLKAEIDRGMAVVFLDRPANIDANVVVLDNFGGACQGVAGLIAAGHRRIGIVGDSPQIYTAERRIAGCRAAYDEAGLEWDEDLVRLGSHDVETAEELTRQLLELPDPPTAIFATNNRNCIGAVKAVAAHDDDVQLLGFDDFELAGLLRTPLDVVAFDADELAKAAAGMLFEAINHYGAAPREVVIPTHVVSYRVAEPA